MSLCVEHSARCAARRAAVKHAGQTNAPCLVQLATIGSVTAERRGFSPSPGYGKDPSSSWLPEPPRRRPGRREVVPLGRISGVTSTPGPVPARSPVRGWGYFLAAFFLRSAQ